MLDLSYETKSPSRHIILLVASHNTPAVHAKWKIRSIGMLSLYCAFVDYGLILSVTQSLTLTSCSIPKIVPFTVKLHVLIISSLGESLK